MKVTDAHVDQGDLVAVGAVGPGDVDVQRPWHRAVGACARRRGDQSQPPPSTWASFMIGNALLVPVLSASIGV